MGHMDEHMAARRRQRSCIVNSRFNTVFKRSETAASEHHRRMCGNAIQSSGRSLKMENRREREQMNMIWSKKQSHHLCTLYGKSYLYSVFEFLSRHFESNCSTPSGGDEEQQHLELRDKSSKRRTIQYLHHMPLTHLIKITIFCSRHHCAIHNCIVCNSFCYYCC